MHTSFLIKSAYIATATCLLGACASTQTTENSLTAAGFRTIVASTPAQLTQLQALPSGKITVVKRNGQTRFIYPDKTNKLLYVGGQQQMQNYKQSQQQNQISQDNMAIAEMDKQTAEIDAWQEQGLWGSDFGVGINYNGMQNPY